MPENLYKLDALQSPDDSRDFVAEVIFPADLSLPKVHDPRKKLLPVRDQGAQGSCVGQATAALKELQENKNIGFEDYMSPQFVYNNRSNQEGEGMYPRNSMDILYKKGIVPEDDYPYGKREKPEQISQDILSKASNYKAKGYAYVKTVEVMKAAIFRSGACCFTVPVYHNGRDMWKPKNLGDTVQGGHAMCAVGWNEEGFILRNSWGKEWNGDGYTIFPYSDWGMHGEVWTLIDDESSKPDPKYSKWYWKTYRAVKNALINAPYLAIWTFFSGIAAGYGVISKDILLATLGVLSLAGIIVYVELKKLYFPKDTVK